MKKIISAAIAIMLTACSSIPVQTETGKLDTGFDFGKPHAKLNKKIALVSPTGNFISVNGNYDTAARLIQPNSGSGSIDEKYINEVKDGFKNGFESLLTNRGFTYSGPYSSFDEITYRDKKNSYLAIIPDFDIKLARSSTGSIRKSAYTEEQGAIVVDGELNLKFIEPLTGQVVAQKRIDLAKLNISEPYIIQREIQTDNNGLVGLALNAAVKEALKPSSLSDNYDKSVAIAMTKFYKGAMTQLSRYVTAEELMDYQADIKELKSRKRY